MIKYKSVFVDLRKGVSIRLLLIGPPLTIGMGVQRTCRFSAMLIRGVGSDGIHFITDRCRFGSAAHEKPYRSGEQSMSNAGLMTASPCSPWILHLSKYIDPLSNLNINFVFLNLQETE